MNPKIAEHDVTVHHGDAATVLAQLPPASANCVVTSPPYYGLRDYGVQGQLGLEESPVDYVEALRSVFAEAWRVLADDGVLWLNLGDSYSTPQRGSDNGWDKSRLSNPARVQKMQFASMRADRAVTFDRPRKSLLGLPWRVAFALQDDGWILRNAVIWNKLNAMPESVTDRLSTRYEHVFLFSKSRHYWFDLDAIREPHSDVSFARAAPGRAAPGKSAREGAGYPAGMNPQTARLDQSLHPGGRNPGDVWSISTSPFPGAHFATMAPALARRCVLAGCRPGGVVLDPFTGSGTTAMVARQLGRLFVGAELNAAYFPIIRDRIGPTTLQFGTESA